FGYIEREDLEKYTFSFDVFFGNPKAMTPGVRVHFTACSEKGGLIATDVKVAPGGTENVDPEIYEAVVTQPIVEPQPDAAGGGAKAEPGAGRLVMTVDGQQKQLPFGQSDLLSTATMFDGDRVRFNIATHPESKAERATYVEILPESFQESNEQRQHGIVIEFSDSSGLIKCSQNPQLHFHMSEVLEKKKLELNEKVDFSLASHETAEGGVQAIRIKRYTESVFLPVRKLGGVGAGKGKVRSVFTSI
uniref:CSD domain-containing protein n=1 Tax=Tetraodon nigroviridis TaxID=99883 RepID=H3D776_TETNG